MTLVTHIDFVESNFGYGPHRLWNRQARQAWHTYYAWKMEDPGMESMAGCCDTEPDEDRSEGLRPLVPLEDRWQPSTNPTTTEPPRPPSPETTGDSSASS
jgi:hypothetical protein